MKFRYEFDIKSLPHSITHHKKLMLVGSCFTENIGEKLVRHKFKIHENPNGILFNPVSVAEAVINVIENKQYNEEDLFSYNEAWHSWQHHSRFSGITVDDALQKINNSTKAANTFLKHADYLLITLGSAWVYALTEKASNATVGTIAANNHKAPADWFARRLLRPEQVIRVLSTMLDKLGTFNPDIKVIFSISPVRHLREGVIENNRSKAVLIQAVHEIVEQSAQYYYFPSYELMIDDLRDYRFYAEDLVHPNYHATQYIWEKFIESCIAEDAQLLLKRIQEINLAYQHKPFNPSTVAHQAFLKKYASLVNQLQEKHPEIDLQREYNYFVTGTK